MDFKRVSYLTYIVAITTIATVGVCHLTHASLNQSRQCTVENKFEISQNIAHRQDDITQQFLDFLNLKGIPTDRISIKACSQSGEEEQKVILTVSKTYKGELPTFQTPNNANHTNLLAKTAPKYATSNIHLDLRKEIDEKNKILRE